MNNPTAEVSGEGFSRRRMAVRSSPHTGTLMIRTIHAASLASLLFCVHARAAEPADSASSGDATAPVAVKVATLDVIDAGATKGTPQGRFGLVNQKGACYAFAPPGGPTVEVGVTYTVIPASNVDDALRETLRADHPKCAIVDVVGRSVR